MHSMSAKYEAGMKIFISWSGERARAVAGKLHEQLPIILQAVEPWMSDEDLASGSHWSSEIAEQLDVSNYGIICVSPERIEAPWLNFEAGAIAKRFRPRSCELSEESKKLRERSEALDQLVQVQANSRQTASA